MKPKKKIAKRVLIAIVILIVAAFGLIDFKELFEKEFFKSKPETVSEQPAVEKPETSLSEQKNDNAVVPDAVPTDTVEPQDSPPEQIKPPEQDDMAQDDLADDSASQNSVIDPPLTQGQKPAIVETDITAGDDKVLAKVVDSASEATDNALSKPTDETADKPKPLAADIKTDKPEVPPPALPTPKTEIFIVREGPGPYPYSIQLASFNQADYATFQKTLQKFQEKGMAPFWVKVDLGDKGFWHRVLSGCFRQKSDAQEVIQAKNIQGALVADTKFAVRIGEYKDEPALRQMLTSLETKGYFPYVIKESADKYVLYVGAFYSRKVAQKTVDELTVQGVPSEAVLR
jgi:hypothetical protein